MMFINKTGIINRSFKELTSPPPPDFDSYPDEESNNWPGRLFVIIYAIIFMVGLFGNFIVIYFVLFYKRMQTMTNKFITNLSVADLLVIFICIPVTASRHISNNWIFGEIICRTSGFIQGVSLSVSVMTLTAISIDRYYIIYKPMKARSICTNRKVKIIVTGIWLLSALIMSPLLVVFKFERRKILVHTTTEIMLDICYEKWPEYEAKLCYEILLTSVLFVFPIIFMSYAYITVSKSLWFNKSGVDESMDGCSHPKQLVLSAIDKIHSFNNHSNYSRTYRSYMHKSNTSLDDIHLHKFKANSRQKSISNSSLHELNNNNNKNRDAERCSVELILNREFKAENEPAPVAHDDDEMAAYSLIDASSIDDRNEVHDNFNFKEGEKKTGRRKKAKETANRNDKKPHRPRRHHVDSIPKSHAKHKLSTIGRKDTETKSNNYSNSDAVNSLLYQLKIYKSTSISNLDPKRDLKQRRLASCEFFTPRLSSKGSKHNIAALNGNQMAIHKLIRSRRRVVKLLIILVFLFLVSWLPYHFVSLSIDLLLYWEQRFKNIDAKTHQQLVSEARTRRESVSSFFSIHVYPIALCLGLANSATNPVCYMALSHGFRSMFKTTFKRLVKCF